MESGYRRRKLFDDSDDDAEAANQGIIFIHSQLNKRIQSIWTL